MNFFFINGILKCFPNSVISMTQSNRMFFITVRNIDLFKVAFFLNKHTNLQFKQLMDLWSVDYLGRNLRFEVLFNFLSVRYNVRVILKTHLKQDVGLMSLSSIYNSANWLEREVWDMYGIFFLITRICVEF